MGAEGQSLKPQIQVSNYETFKSLQHPGKVAWPPRLTLPCLLFWVQTLIFFVILLLTSPFPWQTVSSEGRDPILHPMHPSSLYLLIQVPAAPRTLRDMFALWGKHFLLTSVKSGCRILGLDLGLSFVGSLCVGWCTKMSCTLRYHTDWIYCAHFRDAGAAAPCDVGGTFKTGLEQPSWGNCLTSCFLTGGELGWTASLPRSQQGWENHPLRGLRKMNVYLVTVLPDYSVQCESSFACRHQVTLLKNNLPHHLSSSIFSFSLKIPISLGLL